MDTSIEAAWEREWWNADRRPLPVTEQQAQEQIEELREDDRRNALLRERGLA